MVGRFYKPLFIKLAFGLIFLAYFNFCFSITTEHYAYDGIVFQPANTFNLIMSQILALIVIMTAPTTLKKPSDIIHFLFVFIIGAPAMLLASYLGQLRNDDIFIFQSIILMFFIILNAFRILPDFYLRPLRNGNTLFLGACGIMTLMTFLALTTYPVPTDFLTLEDVYGARANFQEITSSRSALVYYLFSIQNNVVNLMLLCYFIERKQPIGIMFIFALQTYLYLITASKFFFFLFFAAVSIIWLYGRYKDRFITMTFGIFALLSVAGALLAKMDSILLLSLFFRRLLVVPSQLAVYYYDFFNDRDFIMLSNSFPGLLKPYEYDTSLPHLIGRYYFDSETTAANVNLIMDSFAQFGVIGVFVYAVITGLILKYIDSFRFRKPAPVLLMAGFLCGMLLSSTALTTSLLSHGLLAFLVMLYLYPERKDPAAPIPQTAPPPPSKRR